MEITVNFLENLRLEAKFDDYTVVTDQPIRYKGDGSAPSPFDYFLASSALCAAYFVRVYCLARKIPTDGIRLSQNNIVDPENRYNQIFQIDVELPDHISDRDREGILRSIDRCTVKKVVQQGPEFKIDVVESSPYCRSIDTAVLAFGRMKINNILRHTVTADEKTALEQAQALRKRLSQVPTPGFNDVLSSHTANLQEAVGIWPKPEGIAIIFKPDGNGSFMYIATVLPALWTELANAHNN